MSTRPQQSSWSLAPSTSWPSDPFEFPRADSVGLFETPCREAEDTENDYQPDLTKAFVTALLLTKSIEQAEEAVVAGICALSACDKPSDKLLLRAAEAVLSSRLVSGNVSALDIERSAATLPTELQRVLEMPWDLRCCYVLRTLNGLPLEDCSSLLHVSESVIQDRAASAAAFLAGQLNLHYGWHALQLASTFYV